MHSASLQHPDILCNTLSGRTTLYCKHTGITHHNSRRHKTNKMSNHLKVHFIIHHDNTTAPHNQTDFNTSKLDCCQVIKYTFTVEVYLSFMYFSSVCPLWSATLVLCQIKIQLVKFLSPLARPLKSGPKQKTLSACLCCKTSEELRWDEPHQPVLHKKMTIIAWKEQWLFFFCF